MINIFSYKAQWTASWGLWQNFKMSHVQTTENLKIVSVDVKDLRFPTSLHADGSDAMVSTSYNSWY